MSKVIGWCSILILLSWSFQLTANESDPLASIASLEAHGSLAAFEQSIEDVKQQCFANAAGDSARVPCFIEAALWEREMERVLDQLSAVFSAQQRSLLETNQAAWEAYRASQRKMDVMLMPTEYHQPGTMYLALRAQYANNKQAPVVKQRALQLLAWLREYPLD